MARIPYKMRDVPNETLLLAANPAHVLAAGDNRIARGPRSDRIYKLTFADDAVLLIRSPLGSGDTTFDSNAANAYGVEYSLRFLPGRPRLTHVEILHGPIPRALLGYPERADEPDVEIPDGAIWLTAELAKELDRILAKLQYVFEAIDVEPNAECEESYIAGWKDAMDCVRIAASDYEDEFVVAERIRHALDATGFPFVSGEEDGVAYVGLGKHRGWVSFTPCGAEYVSVRYGSGWLDVRAAPGAEECVGGRVPVGWKPSPAWVAWALEVVDYATAAVDEANEDTSDPA